MSVRAPLAGMRVVDFTSMIAGPYCARLLADCGAEVLKIEEPHGDHMRSRPPLRDGHSAYFGHLNAGKKSLVLDLKSDTGRKAALELVKGSDVVLENFRPGVMRRLGLDYAALAGIKRDLVYCSISGFGQTGPRAQQPAYAPVIHAASGFDHTQFTYQDGQDRPAKTGIFVADVLAAVYAFGAIQTALIGRLRHGHGQFIDVALMDSMLNLLVFECQEAQFPSDTRRPLYVPMRARDGFVIVAPVNQRNFEQLADAVGHSEWKSDPRFATVSARTAHWDALMAAIEEWTAPRPARSCEETLMAAGVPCSRYLTVAEALADPQLAARGALARVRDGAGEFLVPNPPFRFADGSVGVGSTVPELGAHDTITSITKREEQHEETGRPAVP
ncbi:Crotonobetainyl-CoA:carnitine CoA-transferase CaiB [Enhydrobacter aerosaccus]|uniref:Crotonobetainyl-CoA:carnitine CoA-transferase CaiB n=1 Tax=Enhydrobacter aerosaccus TaxID=225324 RepID=A0A1T4T0W4_9HYPH|nr:CoA transferase [Enhydrobacter aerosaccus]SKA34140.1 Crotonobetainyl-CoA:carnitine CoA-transferase CaiB [Enhydrobacter aerosaccus]